MDYALAGADLGREELPDLEAQLKQLQEEGRRVVQVRYLGRCRVPAAARGRRPRVPRSAAVPGGGGEPALPLPVQGRALLCMEGEERRIHRALVAEAFQPGAVAGYLGTLLRPLANELVDDFGERRALDLVAEYCHRYPLRVIARLLGIPAANEAQLFAWVRGLFDYPFDPDNALRARDEVDAFLLPLIHARHARPEGDLISRLASAQVEDRTLSDADILSFVKLLFQAGADTAYLTLGSMMNAVLSDAALKERLLGDPALLPHAVDETVRLYRRRGTAAALHRDRGARRRCRHTGGFVGILGVRPAGRDARQYPQPERFDLDRHAQRLVSFGGMPHFCLGVHLARAELQTSHDPPRAAPRPAPHRGRGTAELRGAARRTPSAGRLR